MLRRLAKTTLVAGVLIGVAASAAAQGGIGPDLIVSRIGGSPSSSDYNEFTPVGNIHAYSMGTTSCNIGDEEVLFIASSTQHPVIAQQAYRYDNGRFEMLGLAWLKHGFCAVNESTCGSCQGTPCSTLGIGCADTYSAGLNDGPGLGERASINATTGDFPYPPPNTSGSGTAIEGRLQIKQADLGMSGAKYYFETQYVTAHDHQAGNGLNNVSWREVTINAPVGQAGSVTSVGATVTQEAAIYAWQDNDPNAKIATAYNLDEGGVGVHGLFNVGYRVTDNGDGTWHYEYAVHNQTSDRSAGSFSLDVGNGVNLTNVGFHDVDYHSGEPFSGADWTFSEGAGSATWSTQDFGTNPNANAIRWSTLYNFRFDADTPPALRTATIGLFKPGSPGDLTLQILAPSNGVEPGVASCFGIGCPCANDDAGAGCANSTGSGALLGGSGTTSVAADDLTLTATSIANEQQGLFYMGDSAVSNPSWDGIQCALGNTFRFLGSIQNTFFTGQMSYSGFAADAPAMIVSGTTWIFHCWFRDVPGTPCGTGANFSNAYTVTFTP